MKITSVQNTTKFKGIIDIPSFSKLTGKAQEEITKALLGAHAYKMNDLGKFFGDDKFNRQQMDALKDLKIEINFKPASFSELSKNAGDTWAKKVPTVRTLKDYIGGNKPSAPPAPANRQSTGGVLSRKTFTNKP